EIVLGQRREAFLQCPALTSILPLSEVVTGRSRVVGNIDVSAGGIGLKRNRWACHTLGESEQRGRRRGVLLSLIVQLPRSQSAISVNQACDGRYRFFFDPPDSRGTKVFSYSESARAQHDHQHGGDRSGARRKQGLRGRWRPKITP